MPKRKPKRKPKLPATVTVADAAEYLSVCPQRVLQFIAEDRLPAERFGRSWQIQGKDLEKFASVSRENGRPKK